jgi:hypothetical protein
MSPHRLRRGALHLPGQRSRQNVTFFLREPLAAADPGMPHFHVRLRRRAAKPGRKSGLL